MKDIEKIKISALSTIEEALSVIESGNVKIALIVNESNQLLGTLSDGDIRRGLLKKMTLSDSIQDIYFKNPIVSNENDSKEKLLSLFSMNKVNQIPIINNNNQVVDMHILDDLLSIKKYENTVVLMVGGLGTRLWPLTENTPKPMLDIGGKPILETIVEGFVKQGFSNITMCLGYKSEVIQDFF